ncbi:uncharacterized protein Z518_05499 [Rhinocladiella mackenziei CBS 650.93]|uniref:Zn(2)-C6 fungal-type domain-containing protein n=1 Tax=Rhinocladiella mackenziei CBS 650.93 TaxID=1442369 RepID=A0A0D2IFN7_9EURO|nr:uncharacterized protein Z518_05499 [Rhinocladiella mackenziei CBS 650.93]KIX04629.1 hypothetical protein Z518_05499 [Rhinocladiella mackenziei CBS 650.93]
MGRRQNPLIGEYFQRGAKIGDSSNRYAQTCRRCGQQFPKGRNECLVAHLTKKCASMSYEERTKIVLRLHNLALPNVNPNVTMTPTSSKIGATRDATQGQHRDNVNQAHRQQNFNGLNVLAEASRQVGGNGQPDSGYISAEQAQIPAQSHSHALPVDPRLESDAMTLTADLDNDMGMRNSEGFIATTAPSLASMYPFATNGHPVSHDDAPSLQNVNGHTPDLTTIAASATETLANGMIDGDLGVGHDVSAAILSDLTWPTMATSQAFTQEAENTHTASVTGRSAAERPPQNLRPIAMNPDPQTTRFVTDSGTAEKGSKAKPRGKFAPERRKEVQEVRKLGACLRCRMLKKVCSQETPCQTCSAVESPRLWKDTCIRTKLVDEFPLYSVTLFASLAFHQITALKSGSIIQQSDSLIEAYHFANTKIVFKSLKAARLRQDRPQTGQPDGLISEFTFVIDSDSESGGHDVERYLQAVHNDVVDQEPSVLMKTSLGFAVTIHENQINLRTEKVDNLISEVIELWVATTILTDPNMRPQFAVNNGETDSRNVIDEELSPLSYFVMTLQFRAAVEKRAGDLWKGAVHQLEQRLLSRNRASNFETFLTAFIMLNCAERMSWLYQAWEEEELRPALWPLEHQPQIYVKRAKTFAKIIHLMLHLRQLEPKITVDPESRIIVPRHNGDANLSLWLASVRLTQDSLMVCESAQFDPRDGRSLDGSLSTRLLRL